VEVLRGIEERRLEALVAGNVETADPCTQTTTSW
jgi:hypothetical protein